MALFVAAAVAWTAVVPAVPAHAQRRALLLVRDAEIENGIRTLAGPIWRAAGLDAASIEVHLVQDGGINAFVAGGQRIFINTGLLMRTETAGQLIGVLAHETGHIKGAHLAKLQDALRNATAEAIIEQILMAAAIGVAAGTASNRGAGVPVEPRVLGGGQSMALQGLLGYTRSQEQQADIAGVSYLERAGISPVGLLEFMKILQQQERLVISPTAGGYNRTHPLTGERIEFLEEQIRKSRAVNAADPPQFKELHARMVAKTLGYFEPGRALQKYAVNDRSVPARYGRAMALWRSGQPAQGIAVVDDLIREFPRDPYVHELKGDILNDSQRPGDAAGAYQKAVDLLPSSPALRQQLAAAQFNAGQPAAAVRNLEHVVRVEDRNASAWDLMARSHAALGNQPMTDLATAELFLLRGDKAGAVFKAGAAERALQRGTPAWQRALDIKAAVEADRPVRR